MWLGYVNQVRRPYSVFSAFEAITDPWNERDNHHWPLHLVRGRVLNTYDILNQMILFSSGYMISNFQIKMHAEPSCLRFTQRGLLLPFLSLAQKFSLLPGPSQW